jgi:hypothetical protein
MTPQKTLEGSTKSLTKFQTIALPLVRRGFLVTPVRPDAKAGAAGAWNRWQFRTPEDVLTKYVSKYADCNAGVVGMRGKGNMVFLDNDGGVPGDIISRLPKTYTVATRPDSTHQHFYFTQTNYSLTKFANAKNLNIKDVTQVVDAPRGGKMYKTLFDVKGIGGPALVVAAGSTKPNGDRYTVISDCPVTEIPDWLVDWILAQAKNYERAKSRVATKNKLAKRRAAKIPPEEREVLRNLGLSDGFDIFPADRLSFTRSRAFTLAGIGVTGETMVTMLATEIERYVEGRKEYLTLPHAMDSIRGIARLAEFQTRNKRHEVMTGFYSDAGTAYMEDGVIHNEITVPVRKNVIRDALKEFPDQLTCDEADARLADGLNLVGLAQYDKRRDRTLLSEVRAEQGFEVGTKYWTRHPHKGLTPSSPHITGGMTDMSSQRGGRDDTFS